MGQQHPATPGRRTGGIELLGITDGDATNQARLLAGFLRACGLDGQVAPVVAADGRSVRLPLTPDAFDRWTPAHDTLGLASRLAAQGPSPAASPGDATGAFAREALVALLSSPIAYRFPSAAEVVASVRLRAHTVAAARCTALEFKTEGLERPTEHWQYDERTGFTLRPGSRLLPALRAATQPGTGARYTFSCYRASEYVMLLGIAQELATTNPALLEAIESHWRRYAIQSRAFHDVFLREYGSAAEPFPMRHYVPGDRVWFRNPHEPSADIDGYEGSWVVYLGGGRFVNFWKPEAPFTFERKCVEIYHWRDAMVRTAAGGLAIDETMVEQRVAETMADPSALAQVLRRMVRYRDPGGVYADGGCIDSTRECARWICPGTSDLVLPAR